MICPKCKTYIFGEEKFCRYDGEKLISHLIPCKHCKKEIIIGGNFCEHCGKPNK